MLCKLVSQLSRDDNHPEVISLTDIGPVGREIADLGIKVRALGMKRGIPNAMLLFRLARWLRNASPDIVQTWMYHADLIGGLAAMFAGRFPVIWGVRQSQLDPDGSKRTTIWTARICALLSRALPERIVCCSYIARDVHRALGYASDKLVVIPNGFDLGRFKPDRVLRERVRDELGIDAALRVVGMVARFDTQKDHKMLINAARILHNNIPGTHFVLCGKDVVWENEVLAEWIATAGLRDYFHLLGERSGIEGLLPAFDVACLSSAFGEGFPNVVGEAMACEVPCVATDVGDSAQIIGDTGLIVAPRDAKAFASGLKRLLSLSPDEHGCLGRAARARIAERFELQFVVQQFENLYRDLVHRSGS
jgi:glycosyltransferase involved in cell wall biosynthesis